MVEQEIGQIQLHLEILIHRKIIQILLVGLVQMVDLVDLLMVAVVVVVVVEILVLLEVMFFYLRESVMGMEVIEVQVP